MLFHDGTPCYSSPLQVAYLADRFPDLQVIPGHGGLMDLWGEAMATMNRYPDCHLCLCGSTPPAIFAYLLEQLGTDAGFGEDSTAVFRMAEFRAIKLNESEREAIFWRNAARMLGLK